MRPDGKFVSILILLIVNKLQIFQPPVCMQSCRRYSAPNPRCFFFISFDTVISLNCLYELPLVLMKNVKTLYTLYSERKLKLSGDVETNPGPQNNFEALTKLFQNNHKYLKSFHVNAQNLI